MYPIKLKNSLRAVEFARSNNINNLPPHMSEKEKSELLTAYHPDYDKNSFTQLIIGANKDDRVPIELARLLQAGSRIKATDIDLCTPDYVTDVLIIGGGGAGATAAIEANANGADVMIITKLRFGDSNTVMAEGGIQASGKKNDSPIQHFIDSYGGGHFCAKPELLAKLTEDAPMAIKWLIDIGVEFDRYPDGKMIVTHGGGTSRRRMHTVKDHIGIEIMQMLRDEVLHRKIKVLEYTAAIELILDGNGNAAGAVLMDMDTGKYITVRAKTVIIATGGAGRLHYQGFPTSNHYGATADGLVIAYRAGAKLIFPDSMQYHPTGVVYPNHLSGTLVTEKVRALGAMLVNIHGKAFVNSLDGRDVVASAIIRECEMRNNGVRTSCGNAVWLDTPMIDKIHGSGTIKEMLPNMLRMFLSCGVDIRKEPILVYPTLHYQNGGIEINTDSESVNVRNLYVAGEAAGGIHGRNRLMGNSLLDIIVFGRLAGKNAAKRSKSVSNVKLTLEHITFFDSARRSIGLQSDAVSPILLPYCSI